MKQCPNCFSDWISERWCAGRKLQTYCRDCNWGGKLRTPRKKEISGTRELTVDGFCGWHFTLYDKYGWEMEESEQYPSRPAAVKEIQRLLAAGAADKNAGPYTAVLFDVPLSVTIKGKVFK